MEEEDGVKPVSKNVDKSLESKITNELLVDIQMVFDKFATENGFTKTELFKRVFSYFEISLTNSEYDVIFTKMDIRRTGKIIWQDFITYLLTEMVRKDKINREEQHFKRMTIVSDPKTVPSHHSHAISHVAFCPSVNLNRVNDFNDGKYITCSCDGRFNYWSMDLKLLRSFKSKSVFYTHPTFVTTFVCMNEINVVCVASTERELRFHDVTNRTFILRHVIVDLPEPVTSLYYHFDTDPTKEPILILGDCGGDVHVLCFRNYHELADVSGDLKVLKWKDVVKGKFDQIDAVTLKGVHDNYVLQVGYYQLLDSVVSCSNSSKAMFIGDARGIKSNYHFKELKGILTFVCSEFSSLVATGSRDCCIRLWNPFIPEKPIAIIVGHHTSIQYLFFQHKGSLLYSIDKSRVIKVWVTAKQKLIQTYNGLCQDLNEPKEFHACYNPKTHWLLLADSQLNYIECKHKLDPDSSDGTTHDDKITHVLFNSLFNCLITTCINSTITVWDVWDNKRIQIIFLAHYFLHLGIKEGLPITAATFDPSGQLFLTGARDGYLKVWDYNGGVCLQTITVTPDYEITKVIWIKGRILAVGWNMKVTEFADVGGKIVHGKPWIRRHNDAITAADFRLGDVLLTASFNGELILWKLETGHVYKRYLVPHPTQLIKVDFIKETDERTRFLKDNIFKEDEPTKRNKYNTKMTTHKEPCQRSTSVTCIVLFHKRKMLPDQATFMIALENGRIQAWSHHTVGGFINSFSAVHNTTDTVTTMLIDEEDEFLFTGTSNGYIKIWLMKNYCLSPDFESSSIWQIRISMPYYRLLFPFLIKDRILFRAKRAAAKQPLGPTLLSSYRAHTKAVMSVSFIESCRVLCTGGADFSVRLWTLAGRFIGVLGTNKPWPRLSPNENPDEAEEKIDFQAPSDLKHTGSYTSLKVYKGAPPSKKLTFEDEDSLVKKKYIPGEKLGTYGKALESPILGKFFELSKRSDTKITRPVFDLNQKKLRIYKHLSTFEYEDVRKPKTPDGVRASRHLT